MTAKIIIMRCAWRECGKSFSCEPNETGDYLYPPGTPNLICTEQQRLSWHHAPLPGQPLGAARGRSARNQRPCRVAGGETHSR
jgi:hypothetical protein